MNEELLSRMAETLFWTGRYVERADDTARLVDVYVHRLLGDSGDHGSGSGEDCGPLFGILGVKSGPDAEPDVGTALFRLAYDTASPSAISGSVLAARAGARGIREVISSEMWECLNVAGHGLTGQRRAAERLGPHVFFRFIRERAALFFGLAESTMSHDDAWQFLVLGRSLERADMTARLLLARLPGPQELSWPLLLHACGAYESFIRTHGWAAEPSRVAEFLLLDRLFPRSVLHSLVTAEECLMALNPGPVRMGMDDPARRPVGQLRTRLEYADPAQLPEELPDLLGQLQEACVEACDAITRRYFQYEAPVLWERDG
ncbi:MAG: alpha-E domain-containing protein [Actinomycetota bacterium]|nr:alpha-E domain-containing protein [Actinomycetota bacterium]